MIVLQDYKVTSVWQVIYGNDKWEPQLNCLAELCRRNGYKVEKLQIVAILRDWVKSKSNEDNYPGSQVAVVDIPMWPSEQASQYILDRMALHFGGHPKVCTDEDRWLRGEKWAVMKKGRKKALALCESEKLAKEWIEANGEGYIEHRPGRYVRCESYCNVAQFCPMLKKRAA